MPFPRHFLLKIRPTILIALIVLIGSVIATTLLLQYYFLKDLAFEATQENFKHISQKIEQRTESLDKVNSDLLSYFELNPAIKMVPKPNERHALLPLFTKALMNNSIVYAIYTGFENGNFYEVINLDIDESLRKKYNAKSNVRWLVIKICTENNQRIHYEEYLDKDLQQLYAKEKVATYDPRTRPWYKKAGISKEHIKTNPYMYTNLEAAGITYAKKIANSTVTLGIDVSLESTSLFLKQQTQDQQHEIFIFKNTGKIVGSNQLEDKILFEKSYDTKAYPYEKVIDIIMTQDKPTVNKIIGLRNNEEYFLYSKKLDLISSESEFLAILVPIDKIMQPYMQKIYYSFLITLAILTFTIPLIWYFTRILTNPIHRLAKENMKIQNRQFNEVEKISTNIKELDELSNSLLDMSHSIQAFQDAQKELMDAFIKLIAEAIDTKSNYTGEHCERVPILTMLIAQEANKATHGIFKHFQFDNEEERRELNIAAWLHDCGKVTTPEHIVDKATKLETIYNRIHEIRTRFEVIYRDHIIQAQQKHLNKQQQENVESMATKIHRQLHKEFEIIANANIGAEFMDENTCVKLEEIAQRTWRRYFDNTLGLSIAEQQRLSKQNSTLEYVLQDKEEHIIPRTQSVLKQYEKYAFKMEIPKDLYNLGELYNLSIQKGTLTKEDRFKINEHIIMSIIMLEQLPFPKHLSKVPEYAGAHHETLIGTGYPRKLTKAQMSIPARIMAIADIFEALTATGRPYKEAKTLSQSIEILHLMVKDQHIDEDIFKLFLTSGVYKSYAKEHLKPEQMDEVDITKYV